MEKQFEPTDRTTKKWIKEAGLESPSANFVSNILQHIKSESAVSIVYKPLISTKGWLIIAAMASVLVLGLFLIPFSETFISKTLEFSSVLNFSIPTVELPKTTVYAFGLLVLFIFQIPVLKKYFIR